MADSLRFAIYGTDLIYEVPTEVTNPPIFDIKDGHLRVLSYGFLPRESVFTVDASGQLTIRYDLSAYTSAEIWVYEEAHNLLGLADGDLLLDSYLLYFVKAIERFILNYCALREVPRELWYVWVEMVAMKVRANEHGFADWANATPTTIKDGSQSVTYGANPQATVVGLSEAERTEFLNGWGHQLRQFRRVKWG